MGVCIQGGLHPGGWADPQSDTIVYSQQVGSRHPFVTVKINLCSRQDFPWSWAPDGVLSFQAFVPEALCLLNQFLLSSCDTQIGRNVC